MKKKTINKIKKIVGTILITVPVTAIIAGVAFVVIEAEAGKEGLLALGVAGMIVGGIALVASADE